MAATDEVTQWIVKLGEGDPRAAEVIWHKYFDKLVHCARRRLGALPRRAEDEEDVALAAMQSFCRGMTEGRFTRVKDRENLWKLLVTLTARKASALARRELAAKRGRGRVRGESVFLRSVDDDRPLGIGEVLGSEPTPELASMVAENCEHLLNSLDDETLRRVALHKLEGFSNEEIAEKLGCVRRSVERKLERIREKWSREEKC
jgi:DNA-directed RNA polymerase specialized sigma24 family protein